MANANTYVATTSKAAWATAQTVFQIAAPSTKPIEIYRVSLDQETSSASAEIGVLLSRTTGAVTWTTPTTLTAGGAAANSVAKLNPSDAAPASVVTAWGTGTVTDGTGAVALIEEGLNVLSGYLYLPVPEERIQIAAGTFFAIKLLGTIPSATWDINVVFREIG